MKYKNIYVAASNQHVGKTTSTLGLVSTLLQKDINVGYCKPVGQKYLMDVLVDKDTLLFADLIKFDVEPSLHSPVVLPSRTVQNFIKNPDEHDFEERIIRAKEELNQRHEVTIFEGTGHPGVGSVVSLSNARVAKLLDAGVIMIVEGGIGSTIDMLNMCTALFREEGVPIIGVIINKVRADKMNKVKEYLSVWLERNNIPLLGLMLYDERLAYPLMSTVADSIKATVELNKHKLDNRVESMLAGSLVEVKELEAYQNLLLIASYRTLDRAIKKVNFFSKRENVADCPLSGVIVTGEGDIDEETIEYIKRHELPFLRTKFDTYGAVLKISRIEVKINRHTPWKIRRAIELIKSNINLDTVLESSKI